MSHGRPTHRWRRNLGIAGGAVALFTVVGFFIAPPIVKAQLEKRASAALGRTVTVGKVRVNPYAMSVTVENLDVRLKQGNGSFLGWNRLYLNLDPLASLLGTWTAGAIELDGFHVTALLQPDGSFNFSDILERLAPPAATPAGPPTTLPALRIGSLKVNGARVDFSDQSRKQPFVTTLGPVTFALTEFRTTGARGAPYHFEAVTEASEKLTWTGTLNAVPIQSQGELRLENISLAKYAPYYADLMRTDVMAGRLTLRGRYELDLAAGRRVVKLHEGAVELRDIWLRERANQQPVAEFPALDITGVESDALTQDTAIGAVRVTGGWFHLRRDADGTLNLLKLRESELSTTVRTNLPAITIGEVAVQDFRVDVTDLAAPRPAELKLAGLQASIRQFTLADHAVMPLSLAFDWAPAGTVKVGGTVVMKPELKADLQADVAGLAILPLSPYLELFLNARITQGAVTTAGAVQVAMTGDVPAVSFAGGVTVEKFGLVDGAHNEDLAGFASLALHGLKAATAPQLSVRLDEMDVTAPYARVIVNADQSINLAAVAKGEPATVAEPGQPAPPAPDPATISDPAVGAASLPNIEIGRMVITGGEFTLTDRSLEPNVRMAISQFAGTLTGLSTAKLARGDVDLRATVNGTGPIAITGKLDPFGRPRYAELKLDFKNVDLLPLSPYSGKYAGFELARGQLGLDVTLRVADRKVDMANVITLEHFNFGAPVASPDATSLPVRLGVALLKDTAGRIVIDVPVEGSFDDPSFRISRVVWRVIGNLLTKAAVSPFSLLGSMFGGGGDELAFQEFLPGEALPAPGSLEKLAVVTKALLARPALSLGIEAQTDPAADGYVLKRRKLALELRRQIWAERHAVDPNIPPPDQLEISAEAFAAKLRQAFDRQFPPGTEFGAPLPPPPAAAPPPPAPPGGIFNKVIATVTFKESREKKAREKARAEEQARYEAVAKVVQAEGLPFDEMVGRLAETVTLTPDDFAALATARAQFVRDHLINEGKIPADRLFLAQGTDAAKANRGPRVFLTLQ